MSQNKSDNNKQEATREDEIKANWTSRVDSFDKLDLKHALLRGVYSYGFEKPSFIQQVGIVPLIERKDTIAQAQSGTGKTGAFAIGTLQIIDESVLQLQALVLAPSRELAKQTAGVLSQIGASMGIKVAICTGGASLKENLTALAAGVHVVIGTPGRVIDLISKGKMDTQRIKILILDEADQMLGDGFRDEMAQTIGKLPPDVQIGLYSATVSEKMLTVTKEFMREPTVIRVKNEALTLEGIKQFYVAIEREELKYATLIELYKAIEIQQAIIYANKKETVNLVSSKLAADGFTLACIHGETAQEQRDEIMLKFRTGAIRVILTTDLLARGIDVQAVSLVINYDLPQVRETYIHRIGRTGRMGRKGVAINFVTKEDAKFLSEVESFYSTGIEELPFDVSHIYE